MFWGVFIWGFLGTRGVFGGFVCFGVFRVEKFFCFGVFCFGLFWFCIFYVEFTWVFSIVSRDVLTLVREGLVK